MMMRPLVPIVGVLLLQLGGGVQAVAQTSGDTLAIQVAVARFIKPTLGPRTILESRTWLPGERHAQLPQEQSTTPLLASELGIRAAHFEDAFNCTSCALTDIQKIIAFNVPKITGDNAVVRVEFLENIASSPYIHFGSQEYLLQKTASGWRVTGLGIASSS